MYYNFSGQLMIHHWTGREHWTCLHVKTTWTVKSDLFFLCLPDEAAAGSLPLVSVSLFTPLTPAEMAPYMKRLSRGQTVEGK